MLNAKQRRPPLGETTAHNRRPSAKQLPRSAAAPKPAPAPVTAAPKPATAAPAGVALVAAGAAAPKPALRTVKSVPDLRPTSPGLNLAKLPPSPSFPPPVAAVAAATAAGEPSPAATPPRPQVVFHKEVFIHRHEREFPHLHSRTSSSASVSLHGGPSAPASRSPSTAALLAGQGPAPKPLLSPPPSPPVAIAQSLPRKLALPARALEQWGGSQHHPMPPAPAAGPRRPLLTATSPSSYAVASFASNTDSDETKPAGSSSEGSHDAHARAGSGGRGRAAGGPDDSRSSTDMSSEADLEFDWDRSEGHASLGLGDVAAPRPTPTTAAAGAFRQRQDSVVVLHDQPAGLRAYDAGAALVTGHRRPSFAASVAPSSSAGGTWPGSSPETHFGFQGGSPNPSSLYTTPEHVSAPTFAPGAAGAPPLPSPGLARVRSNEHRRGPSISYRFSSPASPSGSFASQQHAPPLQPGRLSPVKPGAQVSQSTSASTLASSEAHRQAWRISDVADIERELFWQPEDAAAAAANPRRRSGQTSPCITPPPTAVRFDRPTGTTMAGATTWPHAAPVRSARAPLPHVFQRVELAPPPKRAPSPAPVQLAVDQAKPPPAFPPVLIPRSVLAPADRARLDARPPPPPKISIVVEPSSPRPPRAPLAPRARHSSTGSAFSSSYSSASSRYAVEEDDDDEHAPAVRTAYDEHGPRANHMRSRSSISRRRQRAGQPSSSSSGVRLDPLHSSSLRNGGGGGLLKSQLSSAVRGSLYERVERAVRSPLSVFEHVLPAQMVFWLGFVLGPCASSLPSF